MSAAGGWGAAGRGRALPRVRRRVDPKGAAAGIARPTGAREALAALALLGLGATGCQGFGDHYLVAMDPTLSPDQADTVMAASADWMAHVPELTLDAVVTPCSGVSSNVICVHPTTTQGVRDDGGVPGASGVCRRTDGIGIDEIGHVDGGEVFVDVVRLTNLPDLQRAITHEMGHAMGLNHAAEGTIMCANSGCAARGVTADDAAQWRRLRGL